VCAFELCCFQNYDDHLAIVDKVLERLHKNEMKCNPLKCEWFVQETNFLSYWNDTQGRQVYEKEDRCGSKDGTNKEPNRSSGFLGCSYLLPIDVAYAFARIGSFDGTYGNRTFRMRQKADTFSWLPRMEKPNVGKKEAEGLGKEMDFRTIEVTRDEEDIFVNEVPELFPTVCCDEDVDVMEWNAFSIYQPCKKCTTQSRL